jgi:hypothetical protein
MRLTSSRLNRKIDWHGLNHKMHAMLFLAEIYLYNLIGLGEYKPYILVRHICLFR